MTYFLKNTLNELFDDITQKEYRYAYEPSEITNSEKGAKIRIEAPGFEKENLKLKIEDSVLTLSGRQKQGEFQKDINKSYSLGKLMDQKSVKATYKNGVVEISIERKKEYNKTKEIKIT